MKELLRIGIWGMSRSVNELLKSRIWGMSRSVAEIDEYALHVCTTNRYTLLHNNDVHVCAI